MSEEEREVRSRSESLTKPDNPSLPLENNGEQAHISNSTDLKSNLPLGKTSSQSSQSTSITPYSKLPEVKLSYQLTKAEEQAQLKRIERREKIKAINDWIEFITLKAVGISSLIVGGLEIIAPSLLTITLTSPSAPFALVGMGFALLTGKQSIALIKIAVALLEDDKENKS